MTVLEGKWDCSQCNTVGIPGGQLNCPACNDPRNPLLDPSEAPYLPTDARVVTDDVELQHASEGPNWSCGHCGQANVATATVCTSCGEALGSNDDVSPVYTYVSGVDAEGVTLSNAGQIDDDHTDAVLQQADKLQALADGPVRMPNRTFSADDLSRHGKPIGTDLSSFDDGKSEAPNWRDYRGPAAIIGALVVVVTLVAVGGSFTYGHYFKTHGVELTVQSMSWDRQVEVEAYKTLTKTDWTVPGDGRIISSHQAIRSYRQVFDHNERKPKQVGVRTQTGSHLESYACGSTTVNKGNGYFSSQTKYCNRSVPDYTTVYHTEYDTVPVYRQEPIYATQYTYQVDRWVTDHFADAKGSVDPYWPTPTISGSKQRVGDERHQTYAVVLCDAKGKQFSRTIDQTVWSKLKEGETLHGKENRQGSLRTVEWPAS